MNGLLLTVFVVTTAAAPGDINEELTPADPPAAHEQTRTRVEEITRATHRYSVRQGGTMDGRSGRSPMGCGMAREGALLQGWESNRSVRMENVGQNDVVNPWLSNGRNLFRNVDEIVAAAVTPGMSDAEKAFALWFQETRYRFHSPGDNDELGDPVKVINVYGYNTCGNDSISLATLWRRAGLKVAPARAVGHCISQAFYDGRWHFFDGDMHSVYLLRDNVTVAGEQDLVRDHDLIKRTHSKGILMPDTWWDGQGMCALYTHDGEVAGERGNRVATTMNMVLRPGEAIEWRWGQSRPPRHHGALHATPAYPELIRNGLWEYRPDLTRADWRRSAAEVVDIESGPDGLSAVPGRRGAVIWTITCPYVIVGGRLEAVGAGGRFSVSADGKTWRSVRDSLDEAFPEVGPARYSYRLRCELDGPARLQRLVILTDVQMAPLTLPEMVVGENTFTYTDQSLGERRVRITHRWAERSSARPPLAPPSAVYPPDRGESDGTGFVFRWTPPSDPDEDSISDYHFELSGRPDMRFPLSMSFYKLVSRTGDVDDGKRARPQYTLGEPGLLTPDREYFWHVRAMNRNGIWGPWSQTWRFTPRGPTPPEDVTVAYDAKAGRSILQWSVGKGGRTPVRYRVYGSDEKGFSVADRPFQGTVGVSKTSMAAWNPWFPANFIGETTGTELVVIGPGAVNPASSTVYYRVVSVDAQGKRSGPSEYAAAPRPLIWTRPVTTARVGSPYRYPARATRSLGDLSVRTEGGEQVSGYFDIETPRFTLRHGPLWLALDPESGLLSGIPETPGKFAVEIVVTIDRVVRHLDEKSLVWGFEKVTSTSVERIGETTQAFEIDVAEPTPSKPR